MKRDRISRKLILVTIAAFVPVSAFAQVATVPPQLSTQLSQEELAAAPTPPAKDAQAPTEATAPATTAFQPTFKFQFPKIDFSGAASASTVATGNVPAKVQPDPAPQIQQTPPQQGGGDVVNHQTNKKTEPSVINAYLQLSEAQAVFPGFKIEIQGQAPNARAFIRGKIFKECKALGQGFEISRYNGDDGKLGYVIKDPNGAVRSCQAYQKQHTSCQLEGECADLPQPEGSTWALPDKSVTLGVVYQDLDQYEWHHQPVESAKIVSTADIRKARDDADAERRKQDIAHARQVYDECHNKAAGLNDARSAVDQLLELGDLSEEQAKSKQTEINDNELKILSNKAKSCGGDVDEMRDQVSRFASKHPEYNEKIAGDIYPSMVRCVLSEDGDKKLTLEDFKKAKELLSEARGMDDLSSGVDKSLRKFQDELKMGRTRFLAQQGSSAYPDYMSARMQLQQDLWKKMNQSCGNVRSMEAMAACQSARNDYSRIPMTLDQDFNRAIQQEQQMYAQMYQAMNTPLGGGYGYAGGGTAGLGGGTPMGLNPLSGGGNNTNPQLFGQQQYPQQFPQGPQGPQGPMWAGGAYGGGALFR